MAVDVIVPAIEYDPVNRNEGIRGVKPGTACFYCSKPMEVRQHVIVWDGRGPGPRDHLQIAMHPPCALELTIRLNRDVHEAQLKGAVKIQ